MLMEFEQFFYVQLGFRTDVLAEAGNQGPKKRKVTNHGGASKSTMKGKEMLAIHHLSNFLREFKEPKFAMRLMSVDRS